MTTKPSEWTALGEQHRARAQKTLELAAREAQRGRLTLASNLAAQAMVSLADAEAFGYVASSIENRANRSGESL